MVESVTTNTIHQTLHHEFAIWNSDGEIVAYNFQNVSTFVYEQHINESFEGGMNNASTPMDTNEYRSFSIAGNVVKSVSSDSHYYYLKS